MSSEVPVAIKRLPHGEGLDLPVYATEGASGMDVVSAEDLTIFPGGRHAVATGLSMAIPNGFEIQVRPRSGLALKRFSFLRQMGSKADDLLDLGFQVVGELIFRQAAAVQVCQVCSY